MNKRAREELQQREYELDQALETERAMGNENSEEAQVIKARLKLVRIKLYGKQIDPEVRMKKALDEIVRLTTAYTKPKGSPEDVFIYDLRQIAQSGLKQ
jgi:hypothetical protein